jgi:ubiquinone biosynthesis monooxygenase Coq7
MREYHGLDRLMIRATKVLSTITHTSAIKTPLPVVEADRALTETETATSASLMRVNHSGEVSAQALYLGQALTARDPALAETLFEAAKEEKTHLTWCKNRLTTLNARTSFLNPVWAVGSFAIGCLAGLMGDKISLGFLAETENQVTAHLEKHLEKIPRADFRSQIILEKMKEDEIKHAENAVDLGGIRLPKLIQKSMSIFAKIMTTTAKHW